MADVYLGLTQSGATLLPPIRWTNGAAPEIPIDYTKPAERSEVLSGAQRYHPTSKQPRTWRFEWQMLTLAEFADLQALNGHEQALWLQNNWEDATWREVVVAAFDPDPVLTLGPTTCRWNLSMTLEEVV